MSRFKFLQRRRDTSIKEGLTTELMGSVKNVQYEFPQQCVSGGASVGSLCNVLEALFIHGVKESLGDKMRGVLGDPDLRPSPEFWSPLMVYSHSEIIKQVHQLSQITSDVGRSRAWLRLSLNEGLLISYLIMISQDNKALWPYYQRHAYLRDLELLSTAVGILQGLNQFKFSLPVNSSMLNSWPNAPLLLAGLWTPPMKDIPVSYGTDIVKGIVETTEQGETMSIASFPSSSERLLEEEEALQKILGTPIEGSPLQSRLDTEDLDSGSPPHSMFVPSENTEQVSSLGSQVINDVSLENTLECSPQQVQCSLEKEKHSTLESYEKIIGIHEHLSDKFHLEDIMEKFSESKEDCDIKISQSPRSQTAAKPTASTSQKSARNLTDDYVVIEQNRMDQSLPEFKFLMEQLGRLMHERGLIKQNFNCKECRQLIGFHFTKPMVCSLTGCYYCEQCFKPVEYSIPAKILHNWDFNRYLVSEKAADFLRDIQEFPFFDVRKINPRLYFYPEMINLQKLRLQLNHVRIYLFTCHAEAKEHMKRLLWPREYLYEHVHLYALVDLVDIPSGKLEDLLKRTIKVSVDHILGCQLCSQKGFICEVCKNSKVIYPFDIDTTYRCPACRSVFHLNCRQEECPKCRRIKKRKADLNATSNIA